MIRFGSHQSGPTEMIVDIKSNYRNFNTRFLGVKNNDFANSNYLITRILGWPKGVTF